MNLQPEIYIRFSFYIRFENKVFCPESILPSHEDILDQSAVVSFKIQNFTNRSSKTICYTHL